METQLVFHSSVKFFKCPPERKQWGKNFENSSSNCMRWWEEPDLISMPWQEAPAFQLTFAVSLIEPSQPSLFPLVVMKRSMGGKNRAAVCAHYSEAIIFKQSRTRCGLKLSRGRDGGVAFPPGGPGGRPEHLICHGGATSRHLAPHVDRFMFQLTGVICLVSSPCSSPTSSVTSPPSLKPSKKTSAPPASTMGTVFLWRV